MIALLCAWPGYLCCVAAATTPVPVVLDTDLGDDIDDTWALAMMLGSPQIDLKLIVTASDDTVKKTRLVAKILEAMGRTDVPLGRGVKTSDQPIHQEKWLGDYQLDQYKGRVHEDGVQAMIDCIRQSPVPVTLVVIGPQTNIRAALEREPAIAKNARVVAMAGSVEIGYNGKQGADPEWNVIKDIPAAKAVFAAPWDIALAPLDSCGTLILRGDRFAKVAASSDPKAATVIANYRDWVHYEKYPKDESSVLFDTVAAYLAFDEALCEMKTVELVVDDKGFTRPSEKGRPVRCAMGWKDRAAFEDLLVKALTTK
ncbi:MAG TPA: nucleoside hydrolase [Candidatus Hydrogenedentes bacterium]|nr:nucleoside hydrolase [Candidatus Hydrogenedentota bacterium]HOV75609.1 nucleoside hydrolase [Candidatus Hydrogenedentota bacterium]HPC17300.1 nucleoside hydrolase [Candidatus Hydrogenedentota bacterium]HRT20427.1 nucleoside hydrolase [Candidatus Hydrogenedentota bacterium]HRT66406.1 nucleoside hydrolase [Candidatus Hydrogenedentota bacterium]